VLLCTCFPLFHRPKHSQHEGQLERKRSDALWEMSSIDAADRPKSADGEYNRGLTPVGWGLGWRLFDDDDGG